MFHTDAAISQGQRQLLNIARGVAANPPCMILFAIAHRLYTIRNSDIIFIPVHLNRSKNPA